MKIKRYLFICNISQSCIDMQDAYTVRCARQRSGALTPHPNRKHIYTDCMNLKCSLCYNRLNKYALQSLCYFSDEMKFSKLHRVTFARQKSSFSFL